MKKKILCFALAICLILPFGFMLTGCKKDEAPTYTITYDYDYVNVSTLYDNFKETEKVKVSDGVIRNLPKTKSTFAGDLEGWYIKGTDTKVYDGTTINSDIVLEAKWNYLPSGHYAPTGYTSWSSFVDIYSDAFDDDIIICNHENNDSSFFKNLTGKLVISNSITAIGIYSFLGSKLNSIYIPSSVTRIGYNAFSGSDLEKIELPNSITAISERMLNGTNIKYIKIPAAVSVIHPGAFAGCEYLETVEFENNSELWKISEYAFQDCWALKNILIPNSVSKIYSQAFYRCRSLTNINIPASITEYDTGLYASSTYNMFGYIFEYCYNLKTITVDSLQFGGTLLEVTTIYVKSSLSLEGSETRLNNFIKQETSDKIGYDKYIKNV